MMFVRNICLLSLGLLVGCGGPPGPDYGKLNLIEVSGQVSMNGIALSDATIEFVDPKSNSYSYGYTGSDGKYSLMFDSRKSGIMAGEKIIRIRSGKPAGVLEVASGSMEEAGDPDEAVAASKPSTIVPKCYRDDSKIRVNVSPSTREFNFDLATDCSTIAATN